ncbi:MAG: hypothetical protein OEO77_11315 [Acidimicrobiia bacterium]|nr:hypothetical protein [Acidimicrobiia bacterium]
MVRKLVLLAVTTFTVFAVIPIAAANPGQLDVAARQLQAMESDTPSLAVQTPAEELDLGERYVGDVFAFEAQDVAVYRSLDRHAYVDVRIPVALRNDGPTALAYSPTALAGERGYPSVQLVDSEGVVYPLDRRKAQTEAVAGSSLQSIPTGLPAHWTVGFEVPAEHASDMRLELVSQGLVVAGWDLSSAPVTPAGWDAPDYATEASSRDTVQWSDDISLTFVDRAANACGNADLVVSAGAGVVIANVTNAGLVDAPFPNVLYPAVAGVAIWTDGTSARFTDHVNAAAAFVEAETFAEGASDATDQVQFDIVTEATELNWHSRERVLVTPGETAIRALVFPAPRDSRFVNPVEPPAAVLLTTPTGEVFWVDLSSLPGDEYDIPVCTWTQPSMFLGTIESPVRYQELAPQQEAAEEPGALGG